MCTDFARATGPSPQTRQLHFTPGSAPGLALAAPAKLSGLRAAWQPREGGYVLEFFVPAEVLSPAKLQPGTTLGFNFALYDDGAPLELFFCTPKHGGYARPDLWGAVKLSPN
jgi:hypothetical protein